MTTRMHIEKDVLYTRLCRESPDRAIKIMIPLPSTISIKNTVTFSYIKAYTMSMPHRRTACYCLVLFWKAVETRRTWERYRKTVTREPRARNTRHVAERGLANLTKLFPGINENETTRSNVSNSIATFLLPVVDFLLFAIYLSGPGQKVDEPNSSYFCTHVSIHLWHECGHLLFVLQCDIQQLLSRIVNCQDWVRF